MTLYPCPLSRFPKLNESIRNEERKLRAAKTDTGFGIKKKLS